MGELQIYKFIALEAVFLSAARHRLEPDIIFLIRFKLHHQVVYNGHFWLRQRDAVTDCDSSCNIVTAVGYGHWNAYRVLNTQTDYNC